MAEQDPNVGAGQATTDAPTGSEPSQVEDVLVEEVSIDGMCGVY